MGLWTFPVQVRLRNDPPNAGAAQELAAIIEAAVENELGEDRLDTDTMEPLVVCGQPGQGFLRALSTQVETQPAAAPRDFEAKVCALVAEHLCIEADRVTREATLYENLGADSLDLVELVVGAEEELGVEIGDDVANAFAAKKEAATVGDLIELVEKSSA